MALLASYMDQKDPGETLSGYLAENIFKGQQGTSLDPEPEMTEGFEAFIRRYKAGLAIERAAIESLQN